MRYFDLIETPKTGKTFLEVGTNRLHQTDSRVAIYFTSIDQVKYDRYFDESGYPKLKEYALDDEGARYTSYLDTSDENGVYQQDLSAIEAALVVTKVQEAQSYLDDTDFYMTVDKYAQLTEERQVELTDLREEARIYIRANEIVDTDVSDI